MKVGIFGTGAYGLALSSILVDNQMDITMWTKFEEEKERLVTTRKNEDILPGFCLNEKIKVTTSIEECSKEKDLLIIAIPVEFMDSLCCELQKVIDSSRCICIASKGIEQNGLFPHEIVKKYINTKNIAVLSGPSFAKDIISKEPIGLTLATNSGKMREIMEKTIITNHTKIDFINDMIGTEICGAIKNVMAISVGILEGLGANESTKAMLLTKAMNDIKEIVEMFGGNPSTILSYAGVGDLILTCNSVSSRNYSFGKLIGQGLKDKQLQTYLNSTTVEGYYTTQAIYQLLDSKNIHMSLIDKLFQIINGKSLPNEIINFLCEE